MPVVVVATIIPKPECRDDVIAAMKKAIPLVHDEDGCELYALHVNEDRLIMVERWSSPEALSTHGSTSPGLKEFSTAIKDKLAGPLDVITLEAVPAGDPAKGQLA